MATGNSDLEKGYNAAAPITKFTAVKYTASETVGPVTAITDRIAGFAQFGVSGAEILRGKGATVRVEGITEAVVGDGTDIGVGDLVQLMADGRVQKAAASSGARVVGTCVGHPSSNENDRISLRIDNDGVLVGSSLP